MKKITVFAALCCVLFVLSSVTSCVTRIESPSALHSVTAEQYTFMGELKAKLGCNLREADRAVRTAAQNNNLLELSRVNEQKRIRYEYKDVSENRIVIVITAANDNVCDFSLKFGKSGDRDFSRSFLSMVDYEMNRMGR